MATKNPWEEAKTWDERMKLAANQIVTRPEFNYDLNNDPLYNQYRQQYMRQGRLAMMDTMGQAAANNGGYGTSYAQTAGQQAYNNQIQALNDRMPELYQIALDKYQNAGNDLLNRYNMAAQMKQMEGVGGYGGGSRTQNVNLVNEATKLAESAGTGAAIKYIQDQVGSKTPGKLGSGKTPEAIKAMDNAKGVSMTEYYKKMLAAQNAKK